MVTGSVLAAGSGGELLPGMPTVVWVVVGVAAVAYVMISRLRGRPLSARRLLVLPAVFTVIGLFQLLEHAGALHPLGVGLLVAGCLVSFGFGIGRGATVVLERRGGYLWQRYRPVTLAWWLALIGVKIGMDVAAHLLHAPLAGGSQAILLTLGITFLGEAAAIAPRALASGVPFARRHEGGAGAATAMKDSTWQAPSWRQSVAALRERAGDTLL